MIVELRIYTVKPGRLGAALATYEAEALPIQRRHLGEPLGFFVSEIGPLNRIVHLWGYADLADRSRRRTEMEADPAWQALKRKTAEAGNLDEQENWILRPLGFSAIGGNVP